MVSKLFAAALLSASLSVPALASQVEAGGSSQPVNAVIEWNRTLLTIVRTPGAQPKTIHSTRNFAILHAAIFDAVNSITHTYQPYLIEVDGISRRASQPAATSQAAHDVLVSLYPAFQSTLDAELQNDLAQVPDGRWKDEGIVAGEAAAGAILAIRANDGSGEPQPPYVAGNQPGDYQLTPPNFANADFTQWPQVTPFVLRQADMFRPVPPPDLGSDEYTASFDQVESLGFVNSTTRTPEQTQIGKFWNGNIQDFWNEIAQTAAIDHRLNLPQTAHLFAMLNFALADTAIAFFEAKYFYHLWRPVTAIREAGNDGNPLTAPNANWLPLSGKTAPDPSYPGAHSAVSSAGAEILRLELGEQLSFDVTSESLAGVTRHFTGFHQASEEAGLSRIYAGQHFHFDHVAGKLLGHKVALETFISVLQPR